jgi:WD40 repeat protein
VATEPSAASQREDQLDEIVLAYLKAVDAGETPDHQAILARHPDFATELAAFFDDQENINRFSMPVFGLTKEPSGGTRPGGESAPAEPVPSTIAYQPESRERYTIVRFHAGGGIGDVYLAQDADLGRQVALKELKPKFANLPMYQARFLEEARITGQLEHPGIVPVHELTRRAADQKPFYTMRFIKGRTLSHAIKAYHRKREAGETGPLDLRELLNVFVGVCNAVAYAHSRGVIHRDLKPQNVALGVFGEALVLDWGLAKVLGEKNGADSLPPVSVDPEAERGQTMQGSRVGTIPYMAPEQAEGRIDQMDRRTDVYGLGAVLYEILTGEPPFTGPEESMVLDRVKHELPTPARRKVAATPVALEAVCVKALAKKREDRYGSAKELAQEIERFLADEPVAAYPEPLAVRARRWLGKHRTFATAAAAAVIVAGLVLAIILLESAKQLTEVALDETRKASERAETFHYFHRIGLAERDWWGNNVGHARELLAECPDDRRAWEWHYLNRLCQSKQLVLSGHSDGCTCAVFSPDGRRLASASRDRTVRIWDVPTRQELPLRMPGHTTQIWSVAYSKDGKKLASASGLPGEPGKVKVWDMLAVHEPAGELRIPELFTRSGITGENCRVAFSPDGEYLAVASGTVTGRPGQFIVFKVKGWEELFTKDVAQEAVFSVAFSSDGLRLATASGASDVSADQTTAVVQVWDAKSGNLLKSLPSHLGVAYGAAFGVAFSPDGLYLAAAGTDKIVTIWDASTYREERTLRGHTSKIWNLVFRPDSKQIATSSDGGAVKVWDVASETELYSLRGHTADVYNVAYREDGQQLVTAGDDNTVRVWDLSDPTSGQEARTLTDHTATVPGVAFSRDGHWLATGSHDRTVRLWDLQAAGKSRVLGTHSEAVHCVAFSPDGRWLASGAGNWENKDQQGEVIVWNVDTGEMRFPALRAHIGLVWSVAYSPDGEQLATAGGELFASGEVKIWDARTGDLQNTAPMQTTRGIRQVVFSPDGRRLAGAVSHANRVVIWDAVTGHEQVVLDEGSNRPWCVAFSPDSRYLATGGTDRTVRVWDAAIGSPSGEPLRGHSSDIYGLAFSLDGKRLASAGEDLTVKLWDVATRQEALTLRGHTAALRSVAFSFPDGQWIASAGEDHTVKLWNASPITNNVNQQAETKK